MTTAPPTPPPTPPLMASPALPAEVFQGAACYCTPWAETRRGKKEALARLQLIVAQFHFDEIDTSDLLIERNPRRGGSADTLPGKPARRSNQPSRISGRWKTAGR